MGISQTVVLALENQKIIDSYIDARKTESNVSQNFQTLIGNTLGSLSRFTKKHFKRITRDDLISYLNSLRKSREIQSNRLLLWMERRWGILLYSRWSYPMRYQHGRMFKNRTVSNGEKGETD